LKYRLALAAISTRCRNVRATHELMVCCCTSELAAITTAALELAQELRTKAERQP
jgi:hypothetical protein